jgi:hypothetical protein
MLGRRIWTTLHHTSGTKAQDQGKGSGQAKGKEDETITSIYMALHRRLGGISGLPLGGISIMPPNLKYTRGSIQWRRPFTARTLKMTRTTRFKTPRMNDSL